MKKWTDEDLRKLVKLRNKQVSFATIAELLNRSERAVVLKYYRSKDEATNTVPLVSQDMLIGYLSGLSTAAAAYLLTIFF